MSALSRRLLSWSGWQVVGDSAATLGAWYGASWLRYYVPFPGLRRLHVSQLDQMHELAAVVLPLQLLVLYLFGFFEAAPRLYRYPLVRLVTAVGAGGLILTGYAFLFGRTFPRSILVLFVGLNLLLLLAWRSIARALYRPGRRRVVLVGDVREARPLAAAINEFHYHGLDIVGYLDHGEAESEGEALGPEFGPRLGSVEDMGRLLAEKRFDVVILVPPKDNWHTTLIDRLASSKGQVSDILLLPGPFESLIGRMRYRWVEDIPLIEVMQPTAKSFRPPVKRALDLTLGSLVLIALTPVMLCVAIAVKLNSPGPVLYRQERIGRGRERLTVYKFRTMQEEAPGDNEVLAQRGDPRLTSIGGFLRKTRLNELPQLFNVLGGSMSLVGPRPDLPNLAEQYIREVPGYVERFSMAPGVTGLAQINGGYYSTPQNKLRYDLAYMSNWTLWLELSIILRTAKTMFTSSGV